MVYAGGKTIIESMGVDYDNLSIFFLKMKIHISIM
jgi:hypothetical protein